MFPYDDNPDFSNARRRISARRQHRLSENGWGRGWSTPTKSPAPWCRSRAATTSSRKCRKSSPGPWARASRTAWSGARKPGTSLRELEGARGVQPCRERRPFAVPLPMRAVCRRQPADTARECSSLIKSPAKTPFSHGAVAAAARSRASSSCVWTAATSAAPPALGLTRGVVFFLAPQGRDDGRSLLATLARTPATQDLGKQLPPRGRP